MRQQVIVEIRWSKAGHWTAELGELGAAVSYGRSLTAVRTHIKEAIARSGRNPTHVAFVEAIHVSPHLDEAVSEMVARRLELERQSLATQQALGRLVRQLRDQQKLSVRDTGELLGISAPYVHLLRRAKRGRPRTTRRRN